MNSIIFSLLFLVSASLALAQSIPPSNITVRASSEMYPLTLLGGQPHYGGSAFDRRAIFTRGECPMVGENNDQPWPWPTCVWNTVGVGYLGPTFPDPNDITFSHTTDDTQPWIEFAFTQPYSISSIRIVNFPEAAKQIAEAIITYDGGKSIGTFNFPATGVIQLGRTVTATRIRFEVVRNRAGVTFRPAFDGQIGAQTIAGLDDVFFNLAGPPDFSATELAWTETPGVLNFSYSHTGTPAGKATSAKLFWANGPSTTNKLSNTAIFTHSIPSDFTGESPRVRVSFPSLPTRPTGATHILLIVDPDNLVNESSEANNSYALDIALPDLVAGTLAWDVENSGLNFSFTCIPGDFNLPGTSAKLFWATGPNRPDRISSPIIFSYSIPPGFSGQSSLIYVPPSPFQNRPTNATHVLLLVDPDNVVPGESSESNNFSALVITKPDLQALPPVWDGVNARLEFVCSVDPGSVGMASSTMKLFWANGPALANRIPELPEISSRILPATFAGQSLTSYVQECDYRFPPAGATHVLMAVDLENSIAEASEGNNLRSVSLGQVLQWRQPGPGEFTDGSNWAPQKVPGAPDTLILDGSDGVDTTILYREGLRCGRIGFEVTEVQGLSGKWTLELTRTDFRYGWPFKISKGIRLMGGSMLKSVNGTINCPELRLDANARFETAQSLVNLRTLYAASGASLLASNSFITISNIPSATLNAGVTWGWYNGGFLVEDNLLFTSASTNVVELRSNNDPAVPLFKIGEAWKFRARGVLKFEPVDYTPRKGDRFRLVEFKSETKIPEEIDNLYRFHNYDPEIPGSPDLIWGLAFRQEGGVQFGEGPQFIELLVLEKPKLSKNGQNLCRTGNDALVFVTHGTASEIPNGSFSAIADGINAFITNRSVTRWDVVTFNWSDYATSIASYNAATSAQIAIGIAESLYHWMTNSGIQYLDMHVLSHSSGSWLVNRLRQLNKGAAVHMTLFDAFTNPGKPSSVGGGDLLFAGRFEAVLGAAQGSDDFVEHYVHKGPLPPGTNDRLVNAVNFDVTSASGSLLEPPQAKFCAPLTFPAGVACYGAVMLSQHAWPYEWYFATIQKANGKAIAMESASCYGFKLSPEYLEATGNKPEDRARKAALRNGIELKITPVTCDEAQAPISIPVDRYVQEFYNMSFGSSGQYRTPRAGAIWMETGIQNLKDNALPEPYGKSKLAQSPQDEPSVAWASVTNFVELSHAANDLAFVFQFSGNSTGILSVLADGEIVAVFDQGWAGTNKVVTESILLQPTLARGTHQLVFLLQTISDIPASVAIEDVSFGYDPRSLLLTPSVGSGGITTVGVQGVPNRVYSLEKSGAITGPWMGLGFVIVGSNGLATVSDTNLAAAQVFYRAFASGPSVSSSARNVTNIIGTSLSLKPVVGGTPPIQFQWFRDGAAIANQTNSLLELAALSQLDSGRYSLLMSNAYGTAEVDVATVFIVAAPLITAHPVSRTVQVGDSVDFSVTAIGHLPMIYYWRKGGVNLTDSGRLSGTTTSTLTVSNTKRSDSGDYDIVISNSFGMVTSRIANLSVPVPPQWPATNGGYLVWYKADSDQFLALNDGQAITNWLPEVGSSANPKPTQFAGNEIVYRTSVPGLNGMPALEFPGGPSGINDVANINFDGVSIFVVLKNIGSGGIQRAVGGQTSNTLLGPWHPNLGGQYNPVIHLAGAWKIHPGDVIGWVDPTTCVLGVVINPTDTEKSFINGVEINSVQGGQGPMITSGIGMLAMGSGGQSPEPYRGYIAEFLVYPRVLSSDEIQGLNNYLLTKYGLR